jgi:tetratricopeptide (TPR) repeat protein
MRVHGRLLPYLVALWVFLAAQPPLRGAALRGLVLLNRPGGPPLDGVRVNASGANQWVTRDGGRFELDFPGRKAGDTVTLTIALAGYEVVNDLQREAVLPSDPDSRQLTLLLAKSADRDEMARSYYRLKSTEAVTAAYDAQLRILERSQRDTAQELAVLRTERDRALQAADRAAEELAKTKLEDASELYKEALRFFLAGQVEQALKVLDEAKLRAMAQAAQERKAAADRQLSAASQAYRLRGQLLTSQLQFADAEKAYRAAVDATADDFDANFEVAYFSQTLNHFEDAIMFYAKAERISRQLASGNPPVYRPYMATTLNNLGIVYRDENRMDEARKAYGEALEIRRDLARQNPAVYRPDVAATLNNLGAFYSAENRMEEARKAYEDALEIYRDVARQNPAVYRPYVATTLSNLGILYSGENRMEGASKAYEEALEIYKAFARSDPSRYQPDVLRVKHLLDELSTLRVK